jgi:hypothetical protein
MLIEVVHEQAACALVMHDVVLHDAVRHFATCAHCELQACCCFINRV